MGWRRTLRPNERTSGVVTRRCDPSSDLLFQNMLASCSSLEIFLPPPLLPPAPLARHGTRPTPRARPTALPTIDITIAILSLGILLLTE